MQDVPQTVDPFSALGKAMPSLDSIRSSPLPFGAVPHAHLPVHGRDSPGGNNLSPASGALGFRPRREREPLPEVFPSPQYSIHSPSQTINLPGEESPATRMRALDLGYGQSPHRTFQRTMSIGSNTATFGGMDVDVGTDEWMARRVADCVEQAKGDVNMSGLGLERLSSNISELKNLVTLTTRSPPATPRSAHSPSFNSRLAVQPSPPIHRSQAGPSPFAETNSYNAPLLARGPSIMSSRTFGRTASAPAVSAPASAGFFNQLNNGTERARSRLGHEASESAPSPPLADPAALQPSPSIDATGLGNRTRGFGRSKTTKDTLQDLTVESNGYSGVKLNISNNRLSKLPSALFEVEGLVMLSIRHNNLRTLPAAIGQLGNLEELNIANNQLSELPATVLDLKKLNGVRKDKSEAQAVRHFPNQWKPCTVGPHPVSGRYLGPLERHYPAQQKIPSLVNLCWMVAMSPRQPDQLAPLFHYDFVVERGKGHPLNDPVALQEFLSVSDIPTLRRVQQAVRSSHAAATAAVAKTSSLSQIAPLHHQLGRATSFTRASSLKMQSLFVPPVSISHYPSVPFGSSAQQEDDDSSLNPFFEPCPSPRHSEYDDEAMPMLRPSRRIFLHAAEERLEWREVLGLNEKLPIRWKGCSPGCLDFLEKSEDADVDGFDLSDTEIDE